MKLTSVAIYAIALLRQNIRKPCNQVLLLKAMTSYYIKHPALNFRPYRSLITFMFPYIFNLRRLRPSR